MAPTDEGHLSTNGSGAARPETIDLPLTPGRAARVLGALAALVVLAGIAGEISRLALDRGRVGGIVPLFNLDAEANIPAFTSALMLVGAGAVVALIARLRSQRELPHARTLAALAAVLIFLGLDEATAIHELLSDPVRDGLGLSGALYYAWVVVYGAAVIGFVAFFAPKLRHVGRTTRRLLFLAGALYVGGALGLELIGSAYIDATGSDDAVYAAMTTVEESLELAAIVLLVYTVLRSLDGQAGAATLRLFAASDVPRRSPVARPALSATRLGRLPDGTALLADRLARAAEPSVRRGF